MASLNILELYAEHQNFQGQIGGADYFLIKLFFFTFILT